MRVLVTGGLGFVGHAAVRQLVDTGHEPVALSSRIGAQSRVSGVQTVRADLRDGPGLARVVRAVSPEGVCHLAALTRVRDSFQAPLASFEVNVAGTVTLLRALEPLGPVPIVFTSTSAVYGPSAGQLSEDQPTLPTSPYGASKLAAEQLLTYHAMTGAAGVMILRGFSIAGAVDGIGDHDLARIIPKAVVVASGDADHLDINGDGTAVRDFTHVADAAAAIVTALESAAPGKARTYNLSAGTNATVLDVVSTVERVTGRPVPVEHHPPKREPKLLTADSTRLRHDLGWTPRRSTLDEIISDAWVAELSRLGTS